MTIDLSTSYLGLKLESPLVASASPLGEQLGLVRRLEDAGAAAIVLPSLFEEQIEIESQDLEECLSYGTNSYAESLSYFPDMTDYNQGPDGYLEHLRRAKEAVGIPIIASLNGSTRGGWTRFSKMLEQAGADAIELNIFHLPSHPNVSSQQVEDHYVDLVRDLVREIHLPIAIKLSSMFTAPVHFGERLAAAGAKGLVLFNRFYQPDFDLELLEVVPRLQLSNPQELLLRLHWTALMFNRVPADLAITGGVHSATDVIKSMMAGARITMLASVLLREGIERLRSLRAEMLRWLEEHEYHSIRQMQGSMSFEYAPNPSAFERGNYLKVLRSYALRAIE